MTRSDKMKKMLRRWSRSGQSLRQFAEDQELSYSTLLYWKAKLASKDSRPASEPKLVPVDVISDRPEKAGASFEVRCENGLAIQVRAGFDEPELRRLLQVVASC